MSSSPTDPPAPRRSQARDPRLPGMGDLTPPEQVARAALARAQLAARARGLRPGDPGRRPLAPAPGSAGPDARDPQPLGPTARRLAQELGWDADLTAGGLAARWAQVVGPQVAEHCAFVSLEAGRLTVQAGSTAWATNLRLMGPQLLRVIEQEVGAGVAVEVEVLGPTGPGFGRGKRRVPGRGPRDTYG